MAETRLIVFTVPGQFFYAEARPGISMFRNLHVDIFIQSSAMRILNRPDGTRERAAKIDSPPGFCLLATVRRVLKHGGRR